MTKPIFRELDGGSWVVDFGRLWYRVMPDGTMLKKEAKGGKVITSVPDKGERSIINATLSFHQAIPQLSQ